MMIKGLSPKRLLKINIMFFFVCFALTGCDALQNQLQDDRSGGMSKQDYRDALAPRDIEQAMDEDESIPSLTPHISQSYQQERVMPLVSVEVNRSVPLRDIFFQLARQAGYDVELDPRIRGSIIFTARQRPLDQVIERLCDMSGLRYRIDDDVISVELDTPYNKLYKLDYLSFIRSNSSSIQTDITVVSGDGADTGTSFSSSLESEVDFWTELEESLTLILENESRRDLNTTSDPQVEIVERNVNLAPVGQPDENGNVVVSPPDAVINVESLPSEGGETATESLYTFAMNKQAGLINVYANERTQEEIEEFLVKLRQAVTAQVLIEAKVLEVELSDEFSVGIDWSINGLFGGNIDLDYLTTATDEFPSAASNGNLGSPTSAFLGQYVGRDLSALVRAISEFGTSKALASPRLVVLNNQTAVLNVATNSVFFELEETEVEEDENGDETTSNTFETRTVPEGVIINVMPSIDIENRNVSMAIRPSITEITGLASNPFVTGATVPIVSIQEIDTVLNVKSGNTVVIGGLMRDRTLTEGSGVPILSEVPMIGSLFKDTGDRIYKTELVIFLKATILDDPSDSIHDTDRDLYKRFSEDRRPFKM